MAVPALLFSLQLLVGAVNYETSGKLGFKGLGVSGFGSRVEGLGRTCFRVWGLGFNPRLRRFFGLRVKGIRVFSTFIPR